METQREVLPPLILQGDTGTETRALEGASRRYNRSVPGIFNHGATEEFRVNNKYSMKLENKGGSLVCLRV